MMDWVIPLSVCCIVALVFFLVGRSFGRDEGFIDYEVAAQIAARRGFVAGFVAGVIEKTARDMRERGQ